MHLSIDIKGLPEWYRRLNTASKKINRNIQRGLDNTGKLIKREAIKNAPFKTGDLEKSISYKTGRNYVDIKVPSNSKAGRYALIRHYGHYNLGAGSIAKGGNVGRLYIQRAIDDNVDEIKREFSTVFRGI